MQVHCMCKDTVRTGVPHAQGNCTHTQASCALKGRGTRRGIARTGELHTRSGGLHAQVKCMRRGTARTWVLHAKGFCTHKNAACRTSTVMISLILCVTTAVLSPVPSNHVCMFLVDLTRGVVGRTIRCDASLRADTFLHFDKVTPNTADICRHQLKSLMS